MPEPLWSRETILEVLADAPRRLAVVESAVAPDRLRTASAPGEWPAVEILAHLRACGDVWGRAIDRIVTEDHPTFRAVSPRSWVHGTGYERLEFAPSQAAFGTQRAALLSVLEGLSTDDWGRTATVTGGGRPVVKTVHSYADRLARHERTHLDQIDRAVATQPTRDRVASRG